ncbi:MAG: dihydroorotate dehydrogenase [Armatimonadota bacterium]|nr:dihydroorotate dehydrogenase [Armatimonadota bacterium]
MNPSLAVELAGIPLANPVLAASGPFGFGDELEAVVDFRRLGAFITKSITLHPRQGNPPPRLAPTPAGMLNAIGLENPGVEGFLERHWPQLRNLGIPVIVSIAGHTFEEFAILAARLGEVEGIAGIEVNVSCPNVEDGLVFGTDRELLFRLLRKVREVTRLPLIVKLTPNVTDIVPLARAAEEAGADALSLINTVLGMAVDVHTRRPALGGIVGGLSGPAIRPIAVRMTWEVCKAVHIPVIGMGGIAKAEDALEFLIVGATAVAIGSAILHNPHVLDEVLDGLVRYLRKHGFRDIREVIGSLDADFVGGTSLKAAGFVNP